MFRKNMSPLEKQVRESFNTAPRHSFMKRARKIVTIHDNEDMRQLADEPDDCEIHFDTPERSGPGLIAVQSVVEFEEALHIVKKVIGSGRSPETINRIVEHESQHAAAIEAVGGAAIYGISLEKYYILGVNVAVGTQEFCQPTADTMLTKLQCGSAIARPYDLSPSDQMTIENMGYTLPMLGEKIAAHNAQNPDHLILEPLSLQM